MSIPSWHHLNTLREDVRGGTLTLDEFAADLNAVRTGAAPAVYREPAEFFARTYPTYNMTHMHARAMERLSEPQIDDELRARIQGNGEERDHSLSRLLAG